MSDSAPGNDSFPLAFIGGGNMGRSLIGGLVGAGFDPKAIAVADPADAIRDGLARDFGVTTSADGSEAVAAAEVVVLAVKPQLMADVCASLRNAVQATKPLVISIAAGVRIDQIERWLGGKVAVVRVMPNTPALIGAGAAGLCANARADANQRARATFILERSGLVRWIDDEALMDTVTAVSGSGPAYFFALVEALEDAAVAQGLERETARAMAAQTCLGAGRMLVESGEAPAELRRRVTSKGGTTAAALASFEADGLAATVARAVAAATDRGRALAADND